MNLLRRHEFLGRRFLSASGGSPVRVGAALLRCVEVGPGERGRCEMIDLRFGLWVQEADDGDTPNPMPSYPDPWQLRGKSQISSGSSDDDVCASYSLLRTSLVEIAHRLKGPVAVVPMSRRPCFFGCRA